MADKTPAGIIKLDDGPTGIAIERRPVDALTVVHHHPATVLHYVDKDGRVFHAEAEGTLRALGAIVALKQEFDGAAVQVGLKKKR